MDHQAQPLHALTGLRFVAALAVFVHHVGGRFDLPKDKLSLGSFAVSFFFVLSGFILTYVYANRLQRGGLTKFYLTRWARIWPLHFTCLLIAIAAMGCTRQLVNGEQWGRLVTNALLLQSWVPNTPWVFSFNGVAWSISTELFFYLMFPLFLIGGQKKFWFKYAGLLAMTVIVLLSLNRLSTIPAFQNNFDFYRIGHVNPLLRLPEFCTGMAVGFVHLNKRFAIRQKGSMWLDSIKELSCFGGMIGCWLIVNHFHVVQVISTANWGGEIIGSWFRVTYSTGFFALTVFVFARSSGLVGRLMSSRWLVFLGEISFAFYMIHFIVIRYVDQYAASFGALSPWMVALCCLGVSIALSIILFKLVEMPAKTALLSACDGNLRKRLRNAGNLISGFAPFGIKEKRYSRAAADDIGAPKILKTLAASNWKFVCSSLAASTAVVLVVSISTLVSNADCRPSEFAIKRIVNHTPVRFRNVSFGNQIELLGFEVSARPLGFEVTMAWKKRTSLTRRRFVHICDASGQIIGYGRRNDQIFEEAGIGDAFVESVLIKNEQLVPGTTIGLGFHAKGQGMAVVNKGPRSMRSRRLDLSFDQSVHPQIASRLQRIGRSKPTVDRRQR